MNVKEPLFESILNQYSLLSEYSDEVECHLCLTSEQIDSVTQSSRYFRTIFCRNIGMRIEESSLRQNRKETTWVYTWDGRRAAIWSKRKGWHSLTSVNEIPVLSKLIQPWFLLESTESFKKVLGITNIGSEKILGGTAFILTTLTGLNLRVNYNHETELIDGFEWNSPDFSQQFHVTYSIHSVSYAVNKNELQFPEQF